MFEPVIWHRWFRPFRLQVYIVTNPVVSGNHTCWVNKLYKDPATGTLMVKECAR